MYRTSLHRRTFGAFALLLLLAGCGGGGVKPPPRPEKWEFQPHAIHVTLKGDTHLNWEAGNAHSLLVGLYQLSDPNYFNDTRKTAQGLQTLLQDGAKDPSVVKFDPVILQPGEYKTLYLDRAEGAKYVGVVAGYYDLTPEKVDFLFGIPLETGPASAQFYSGGQTVKPGTFSIILVLGRDQIDQKIQRK